MARKFLSENDLSALLNREDLTYDSLSEASDSDEDFVIEDSIHDSDSDIEIPEASSNVPATSKGDNPQLPRLGNNFQGKNGHRWSSVKPSRQGRTAAKNLITHLPGTKGNARLATTILQSWELFFSQEIINIIVEHTNEEIMRQQIKYSKDVRYVDRTDALEIRALIGLLYKSGVLKDSHVNLEELWSVIDGPPIFQATMSLPRIKFLLSCLRFDEKTTRLARKEEDAFAAIRTKYGIFLLSIVNYFIYPPNT